MSIEQENKELESLRQYLEKNLSSKESATEFFVRLGSHDKNGNLTDNYKR
jgi:hypothetical protein